MWDTLTTWDSDQNWLYFESHNPFVPMFPDASAAKKHSTSPPLEDKGEEDEDEEENGDEDADADEDEDSDEETRRSTVVQRANEVRGMGKVMKTCASSASRARSIIRRMEIETMRVQERCCCCEKSQNLNPFNRAAVVCL